jgi:hypothetical protein
MLAVLSVEARKLNRSLAALLAVAAPALIAVFGFFMLLRRGQAQALVAVDDRRPPASGPIFMMPMSVTALTALVAHMEHGPRSLGSPAGPAHAPLAHLCRQGVLRARVGDP